MSLADPLKGHFEYTEFFHMPWLWQDRVDKVLMVGLGGGSAQRAFAHYHPDTNVDTVELDPKVKDVAQRFFHVEESETLRIHIGDGRVFVRRSPGGYNAIILDAYTSNRYGTFVPHHLATREFFQIASEKLTANGALLYNVIGATDERNTNALGSIYNSMAAVFPQIYLFPAQSSRNVVLMGLKEPNTKATSELKTRATELIQTKNLPDSFPQRLNALRRHPPASINRSPILTDNYTPPRGLMVERR